MIISKLSGGIGNQLFQYAAGYARATEHNTVFKLDVREYTPQNKRNFLLDNFTISAPHAHIYEIAYTKYIHRDSYLTDYFQDTKYFKNNEDAIRKEFTLKIPLQNKYPDIVNNIKNTESVSIHIRRTDYLDKQHRYIILTPEYYTQAIQKILSIKPQATFYFFSDDIEWAKQNIQLPTHTFFVSGKEYADYEELGLMSLCKHNITANSTFSWWGAWLNTHPEKIVITPQKWFVDTINQYISTPTSWILL